MALTYNLQEQKPWSLDWGFFLQIIRFRSLHQLKLFFPCENVIQEQHQWPDSTVQSHQWAAIDGSTCAEMFLLRIMYSHQSDRAWSHILRITPKLHNNVIQLPWKHFCLSSQRHSKAHLVLLSMRGPIPGLHKQNWIKTQGVQMVQMPLSSSGAHTLWLWGRDKGSKFTLAFKFLTIYISLWN